MGLGLTTYRVEYKTETGQIRLDNGSHLPDTHGWNTIAEGQLDLKATQFIYFAKELFKARNMTGVKIPTLRMVQEAWFEFNLAHNWITNYEQKVKDYHNEI